MRFPITLIALLSLALTACFASPDEVSTGDKADGDRGGDRQLCKADGSCNLAYECDPSTDLCRVPCGGSGIFCAGDQTCDSGRCVAISCVTCLRWGPGYGWCVYPGGSAECVRGTIDGPDDCRCFDWRWFDEQCEATEDPCSEFGTQTTCAVESCGWCADGDGACMRGSECGPADASVCNDWRWWKST